MQWKPRQTNKAPYIKQEYNQQDFIPYNAHWDEHTILTKNNDLLSVIKLEGFSFETADDIDLDVRKELKNTLYKSINDGNIAFWFNIIRRKQETKIAGEYDNKFSDDLNKKWTKSILDNESFVNEMYITVMVSQKDDGISDLASIFKRQFSKGENTTAQFILKNIFNTLKNVRGRIIASLEKDYSPKLLGIRSENDVDFSEPVEFLSQIVNGGIYTPIKAPNRNIDRVVNRNRLYFGSDILEISPISGEPRFCAGVSIKEYPNKTYAGMFDGFLKLPFELIISHSFTFTNRQEVINRMSLQQKRMIAAQDKAISQTAELTEAMDMAQSGDIGFGKHHCSVFAFGNSIAEAENNIEDCFNEFINTGIGPVRESFNLQGVFWSQLPGNYEYLVRDSVINTLNYSAMASMHNYPSGKKEGNHWGDAVTVFNTVSGTPFYFNFHVNDVGHSFIVGPTGAGKTVLLNFLVSMAQKFNCRTFFFDKDRGAEIFIRAINGQYLTPDPGKISHFNPLQLDDTPENRSFLVEWLISLAKSAYAKELKPDEIEMIDSAVDGNFKLRKEDRVLRNISAFFGIEMTDSIASRLKMWHSGESHARLFDNAEDKVDFKKSRVFGFEMGRVLSDEHSLAPVLLYLFHKINQSLDGTPTIIVLDEAWALIDNEIFAPKIKDWLKTLRKLNAIVVFATQSVEDASKSNISDTLVQQTSTQIYLPNPRATAEYRDTFMLSEREFSIIKGTDPTSRFFLVKQSNGTVVARINLKNMPEVINILSGRAETVRIMDEVIKIHGNDPEIWVPILQEKLAKFE